MVRRTFDHINLFQPIRGQLSRSAEILMLGCHWLKEMWMVEILSYRRTKMILMIKGITHTCPFYTLHISQFQQMLNN